MDRDKIKGYALIALGTLILSLGAVLFIFPTELVTGGMTGLAVLIDTVLPFEFITTSEIVFVLSIAFLVLGFVALGRQFVYKTLLSSLLYPAFVALLTPISSENFLGGFFSLSGEGALGLILSAVFGGVLVGVGCAITFIAGGSTGGTDILALILCKHIKGLKSSVAIFLVDGLVILIGAAVTQNLARTLLGITVAIITASVIDKFLIGHDGGICAEIITENADEITAMIIGKLKRTATVVKCRGAYGGDEKSLVLVSISMREYSTLVSIVKECDAQAFITVMRAHEIRGVGW